MIIKNSLWRVVSLQSPSPYKSGVWPDLCEKREFVRSYLTFCLCLVRNSKRKSVFPTTLEPTTEEVMCCKSLACIESLCLNFLNTSSKLWSLDVLCEQLISFLDLMNKTVAYSVDFCRRYKVKIATRLLLSSFSVLLCRSISSSRPKPDLINL